MTDKGLISKIYRQFIQLNIKKKNEKMDKDRNSFARKIYRWSAGTIKDAQPLIIREKQIKTTISYHFTPVRMAIIKTSINRM